MALTAAALIILAFDITVEGRVGSGLFVIPYHASAPPFTSKSRLKGLWVRSVCYTLSWPLHDIAIIDIVWCMAYKGGGSVGRRILRNGRAIVSQ